VVAAGVAGPDHPDLKLEGGEQEPIETPVAPADELAAPEQPPAVPAP